MWIRSGASTTLARNSRAGSSHEDMKSRKARIDCLVRVFESWRQITAVSALLIGLLFAPTSVKAQAGPAGAKLPRTADGRPDLGGIWQVRNTAGSDLLAHTARLLMPPGH